MKTIKQFLLTLLLIALACNLTAKENKNVRGDSIRIQFDYCLLEVATFDIKVNTLQKAKIREKVNELLIELEKVEIGTPEEGDKIYIKYTDFIGGMKQEVKRLQLFSVENMGKNFVLSEDKILETDFGKFVLQIEDEDYLIRLYLNNLEDAKKIGTTEFAEKLIVVDSEIPKNRKKINVWFIDNKSGSFNSYFIGETPPYTLDMLGLNAGITSGLVKNQFVTGFNLRVGLGFAKKGIMKSKYFTEFELVYDFSNPPEGKSFVTNNFLSVGYDRNFSLDPNKEKWYGFSVGYLINRNNDFFEKNTFKVSLHKQINNSISLKPEIYFNDFFKNIYPGLRVQISF